MNPATPPDEELRAAVDAHGLNAVGKIRKRYPSMSAAGILALIEAAGISMPQRRKVHHTLVPQPKSELPRTGRDRGARPAKAKGGDDV